MEELRQRKNEGRAWLGSKNGTQFFMRRSCFVQANQGLKHVNMLCCSPTARRWCGLRVWGPDGQGQLVPALRHGLLEDLRKRGERFSVTRTPLNEWEITWNPFHTLKYIQKTPEETLFTTNILQPTHGKQNLTCLPYLLS